MFDSAHPNQPGYTSGQFQNTLKFTQVLPLRVHGVGIHYIGKGLDVPAPTVSQLRTTLFDVSRLYPTGQIFITGFDVIDYEGDFQDMSGDGCGSGWDALLDRLRGMQGDSGDVYYGLVPLSVPSGAGGCGGGDGSVAAGFVNETSTAHKKSVTHLIDAMRLLFLVARIPKMLM